MKNLIILFVMLIIPASQIEAKPTTKSKYKTKKSICKKKNIKPSAVWYGGKNKSKAFR